MKTTIDMLVRFDEQDLNSLLMALASQPSASTELPSEFKGLQSNINAFEKALIKDIKFCDENGESIEDELHNDSVLVDLTILRKLKLLRDVMLHNVFHYSDETSRCVDRLIKVMEDIYDEERFDYIIADKHIKEAMGGGDADDDSEAAVYAIADEHTIRYEQFQWEIIEKLKKVCDDFERELAGLIAERGESMDANLGFQQLKQLEGVLTGNVAHTVDAAARTISVFAALLNNEKTEKLFTEAKSTEKLRGKSPGISPRLNPFKPKPTPDITKKQFELFKMKVNIVIAEDPARSPSKRKGKSTGR